MPYYKKVVIMTKDTIGLIKKEVNKLEDYLILITTDIKQYQNTDIEVIKYFINNKTPGIYITLNKPYDIIERALKKNNIDSRLIIFIDGATQKKTSQRLKNCLFIGSPERLSDISVAIDQAAKSLPKDKFLFFDSIDTLLVFNNAPTVARFVHYLAGKIRELKLKGVIISLKRESDKEILAELTQLSDSTIHIGGK